MPAQVQRPEPSAFGAQYTSSAIACILSVGTPTASAALPSARNRHKPSEPETAPKTPHSDRAPPICHACRNPTQGSPGRRGRHYSDRPSEEYPCPSMVLYPPPRRLSAWAAMRPPACILRSPWCWLQHTLSPCLPAGMDALRLNRKPHAELPEANRRPKKSPETP